MPKYYIKYCTPKADKSSWKIIGYSIMVENEKGTYNYNDFFSVEDMKTLYWCNSEMDCLNLKWKECELIVQIKIKK